MSVRRGKHPEMSPKRVGRVGLAQIKAVVRKAAPPEFVPKKNGKLAPKDGAAVRLPPARTVRVAADLNVSSRNLK